MTFTTDAPVSFQLSRTSGPAHKRSRTNQDSIKNSYCKCAGATQRNTKVHASSFVTELRRKVPSTRKLALAGSDLSQLKKTIDMVTRHWDVAPSKPQIPAMYNRYEQENYPGYNKLDIHTEMSFTGSSLPIFENCENIKPAVSANSQGTASTSKAPYSHQGPRSHQQQQGHQAAYNRYSQEEYCEISNNFETEGSFAGADFTRLRNQLIRRGSWSLSIPPAPSCPPMRQSERKPVETSCKNWVRKSEKLPIIIVPNTATGTMINMYNAKDVLENSTFVTPEARKSETKQKSTDLVIRRKRNGKSHNIRVVDCPERLTREDWDHVIGCFVLGQEWQFKGWKWNGNPTTIFANIPAFHLYSDDRKPSGRVPNWNVRTIPVSLEKRHQDKMRFGVVWDAVYGFVRKNKPELCSRIGL